VNPGIAVPAAAGKEDTRKSCNPVQLSFLRTIENIS
jgi:hypothetical protein